MPGTAPASPVRAGVVKAFTSGAGLMGRVLALPLVVLLGMGLDLPENGPVPAENPRQPQSVAKDPPLPVPKPSPEAPGPRSDAESAPVSPRADTPEPSNGALAPQEKSPEKTEKPALPDIKAPKDDEAALAHCEAELRKLGAVF
ncbi:MAG: hypothetical protein U1A06_07750, partial [Hoeflea sp.]|nr:hypothetical protein [Hoeflea sp.]